MNVGARCNECISAVKVLNQLVISLIRGENETHVLLFQLNNMVFLLQESCWLKEIFRFIVQNMCPLLSDPTPPAAGPFLTGQSAIL